jgi:hypothetical protein
MKVREAIFKPGEARYLAGNLYAAFRVAREGLVAFLANSEELEDLVRRAKQKVAERNGGELRLPELPEYPVFVSFGEVLDEARKAAIEALLAMYKGDLEGLSRHVERLNELDSALWKACKEVYNIVRKYDDVLAERIYWHPTLVQGLGVVAEDVAKYVTVMTGRAPEGWRIVVEVM